VCGEQSPHKNRINRSVGSPPRVRGAVLSELSLSELEGITPACAGSSCFGMLSY